jgi:peptidoglycan/LPS O-acetylase OafA/YrhL
VRAAPVSGRLDQVDVFRTLTFAAVVAVHTVANTNGGNAPLADGVVVVLHFTREAFFFLTGLVLAYANKDRSVAARGFWRRRVPLVLVPYLVWSFLYWLESVLVTPPRSTGQAISDLVWGVLGGHSKYHLYFLLVTVQVYLVFPLLLPLVRRCLNHVWWLVGAAVAYEIAVTAWLQIPSNGGTWLGQHAYVLLPSYLLWVVLGIVTGLTFGAVQAVVLRHARVVTALSAVAVVGALAAYAVDISVGESPSSASTVLQPLAVLNALGVIGLLAVASVWWGGVRQRYPRVRRALLWCSSASFGVYLAHPLVLDALLAHGFRGPHPTVMGQPAASVVAWALTLVGSGLLVALFRKTPLMFPLTGRARVRAATPCPRPTEVLAA